MKINKDEIFGLEEIKAEGVECPEKYFSYIGCDNCNNGLGNDVYDCRAWFWIDEEKLESSFYEIKICGDCLYSYHYGEEIDKECENIYNI